MKKEAGDLKAFIPEGSEFICKCGKVVQIGEVGTEFSILHAMEPCPRFLRLGMMDYLRWLRDAREN